MLLCPKVKKLSLTCSEVGGSDISGWENNTNVKEGIKDVYGGVGAISHQVWLNRILGRMLYINCDQDHCKTWNRCTKKYCENQCPWVYKCACACGNYELLMVAEVGWNNGLQSTGARNSWKSIHQLFTSKNTCMEDNLGRRWVKVKLRSNKLKADYQSTDMLNLHLLCEDTGMAWHHHKTKVMWDKQTDRAWISFLSFPVFPPAKPLHCSCRLLSSLLVWDSATHSFRQQMGTVSMCVHSWNITNIKICIWASFEIWTSFLRYWNAPYHRTMCCTYWFIHSFWGPSSEQDSLCPQDT